MLTISASWKRTLQHWLCRILITACLAAPLGFAPAAVQAGSCLNLTDVVWPGGPIVGSVIWQTNHVYILHSGVTVPVSTTLTIQAGAIVKFDLGTWLDVFGTLNLTSTMSSPVRFTSIRDDDPSFGCDTNGDGAGTTPNLSDWLALYIEPGSTLSGNAVLRYSQQGLNIYDYTAADMSQAVTGWTFEKNYYGLTLSVLSSGNITSAITNNTFSQNWSGLYVTGSNNSGAALPTVSGNTFSSQQAFPIYLHGTAFPTYSSNTFGTDGYHAIGLGGTFFQGGTLPLVPGGAETGGINFPYVLWDNLSVSPGITITLQLGTVVKGSGHYVLINGQQVWVGYWIDVIGALNLQGTSLQRIVFTSFWDDTYGGDANGDGGTTSPNPGDWGQIYLENSQTNFTNVRVRYSTEGVEPWNGGASPIAPPITSNIIEKNKYSGILMYARGSDINSVVSNNLISDSPYGLVISITQSAVVSASISNNTFERHTSSAAYLDNTNGFIGGTFSANQFNDSADGAQLSVNGSGDIDPTFSGNTFYSDTYGVRTNVLLQYNGSGQVISVQPGASRPVLNGNTFNTTRAYPIYLGGTAWPTYLSNTFSGSYHKAIGLAGYFANTGGTWPIITGDSGQPFPYVVADHVYLWETFTDVTLQAGAVIKFNPTRKIMAWGPFRFSGTLGTPTVITSINDDSVAGDTGADGPTVGAKDDWEAIYMFDQNWHNLNYFTLRFSTFGLSPQTTLPDNTNDCPTVSNATFDDNGNGISVVADLAQNVNACPSVKDSIFIRNGFGFATTTWGDGNILSTISNSQFLSNTYGILTDTRDWVIIINTTSAAVSKPKAVTNTGLGRVSMPERMQRAAPNATNLPNGTIVIPPATGVSVPTVRNNYFSGNYFPLYMGGTGFPVWVGNTYGPYVHRGIRLGGTFDNSRIGNDTGFNLPQIDDGTGHALPYAITNDPVPCTLDGHCTLPYWLIQYDTYQAHGATVGALPGTVFKVDQGNEMDILGQLDLQGIQGNPVIFTSYRDDAILGDTNADLTATTAAPGDWKGIYLQSNGVQFNYVFDYAFVKYAADGISIWMPDGNNLFPVIANNSLTKNIYGVSLYQQRTGNIIDPHDAQGHYLGPLVHDNYFSGNTEHIHVTAPTGTGRTSATMQNNCFLPTANYGIDSLSALNVVTGTSNWWNAANGPYHSTNPAGQGLPVSDNVLFNPWLSTAPAACQISTSGIQGRVARPDDTPQTPDPLPGVTLFLNAGSNTQSNGSGNFSFNSLTPGQYQVTPVLNGYVFSPVSLTVDLPPSAAGLTFTGSPVVGQTYSISGRVTDRANQGVGSVSLLASASTQSGIGITDASGYYTVTSLLAGSYTITPYLAGYLFLPPWRQVVVAGNVSGQDFIRRNLGETNYFLYLPDLER